MRYLPQLSIRDRQGNPIPIKLEGGKNPEALTTVNILSAILQTARYNSALEIEAGAAVLSRSGDWSKVVATVNKIGYFEITISV